MQLITKDLLIEVTYRTNLFDTYRMIMNFRVGNMFEIVVMFLMLISELEIKTRHTCSKV
jgi:hypothetical protein